MPGPGRKEHIRRLRNGGLRMRLADRPQGRFLGHIGRVSKLPPMPTPMTPGGQGCEPARSTTASTYFSIVAGSGEVKISSAAQQPEPGTLGEQLMSTQSAPSSMSKVTMGMPLHL